MLHHVASYQLYRAIGESDSPHRRERALWAVQKKVMALDYVLAHPGARFLPTEADKLAFFSAELGLIPASFPSKAYRRNRATPATRRYFVDRSPIHFATDEPSPFPVVSFCYIDDGLSLSGFQTRLAQYESLLAALGRFRAVFASSGTYRRARAERIFQRFAESLERRRGDVVQRVRAEILDYFRLRDALERKDYKGLTTADLDRLRALRRAFESPQLDVDFVVWRHGGDDAAIARWRNHCSEHIPSEARFAFFHLDHDYRLFFGV